MELTALELRDKDPAQFEKVLGSWREHALDYEWWDCIEEGFKEKCKPMGLAVDRIYFTGFYCQGDHAGFEGRVDLDGYMKHFKMDEEYPALYEAVVEDGSYLLAGYGRVHRGRAAFELYESTHMVDPIGVFKGLDEEAWNELINDQWRDSKLEKLVTETCNDLCHDLHRDLEKEYEYLTSEESFIESCECNEVKFEYEGEEE